MLSKIAAPAATGVFVAALALGCSSGGHGGGGGNASTASGSTSTPSNTTGTGPTGTTPATTASGTLTGVWMGSWQSTVPQQPITILGITTTPNPPSGSTVLTMVEDSSANLTGSATLVNSAMDVASLAGSANGGQISFAIASGNGVQVQFSGVLSSSGTEIEGNYQETTGGTDAGVFTIDLVATNATFPATTPAPPPATDLTATLWEGPFVTSTGSGVQGTISVFSLVQDAQGYLAASSVIMNGGTFPFGIANGTVASSPTVLVIADQKGSGNALVLDVATVGSATLSGTYSTWGPQTADSGTFTLTRH